jgi:pyruvate/2-oxoglutarate dehydrogenase complex dihydrolipoamide acyltransferase (E2) component
MNPVLIRIPDIGGFADVAVVEVHVAAGDDVAENDPLITLETDKATMDVPAPLAGTVAEVLVNVGDTASEGTVVAKVQAAEEVAAHIEAAAPDPVRSAIAADASGPRAPLETSPPNAPPPVAGDGSASTRARRCGGSVGSSASTCTPYHLGFAADTPNGLVVPVIRDVDKKGILEVAGELTELSGKARAGKLGPNEMAGGTFTISSLGGIGGTSFTPIVNAPQVGILGVVRSAMKPVWNGQEFVPRLMLPLSLSYDHRVIDGAAAARFTTYLAGVLTDLRRILL